MADMGSLTLAIIVLLICSGFIGVIVLVSICSLCLFLWLRKGKVSTLEHEDNESDAEEAKRDSRTHPRRSSAAVHRMHEDDERAAIPNSVYRKRSHANVEGQHEHVHRPHSTHLQSRSHSHCRSHSHRSGSSRSTRSGSPSSTRCSSRDSMHEPMYTEEGGFCAQPTQQNWPQMNQQMNPQFNPLPPVFSLQQLAMMQQSGQLPPQFQQQQCNMLPQPGGPVWNGPTATPGGFVMAQTGGVKRLGVNENVFVSQPQPCEQIATQPPADVMVNAARRKLRPPQKLADNNEKKQSEAIVGLKSSTARASPETTEEVGAAADGKDEERKAALATPPKKQHPFANDSHSNSSGTDSEDS